VPSSPVRPESPSIRLVVAEQSYLLREGVARIVGGEPDLELVGACGDLGSLRTMIDDLRPDVLLTDAGIPPGNGDEGVALAVELRDTHPDMGVVVLSRDASPASVDALLADGASGRAYVLKDRITDSDGLAGIVRNVAAGGSHLDQEVINAVFDGWDRNGRDPVKTLTPRETDVLELVASGSTNAAIADRLGIGKRAVERHVNSIFEKLDLGDPERVSRRVKATLAYLRST
jgi:DNA-binding NarL/FixJ family response regulator